MSWLPGVPVPKVRLGLPAKEVKSIHQKTPLAVYAVSKGCHATLVAEFPAKGNWLIFCNQSTSISPLLPFCILLAHLSLTFSSFISHLAYPLVI